MNQKRLIAVLIAVKDLRKFFLTPAPGKRAWRACKRNKLPRITLKEQYFMVHHESQIVREASGWTRCYDYLEGEWWSPPSLAQEAKPKIVQLHWMGARSFSDDWFDSKETSSKFHDAEAEASFATFLGENNETLPWIMDDETCEMRPLRVGEYYERLHHSNVDLELMYGEAYDPRVEPDTHRDYRANTSLEQAFWRKDGSYKEMRALPSQVFVDDIPLPDDLELQAANLSERAYGNRRNPKTRQLAYQTLVDQRSDYKVHYDPSLPAECHQESTGKWITREEFRDIYDQKERDYCRFTEVKSKFDKNLVVHNWDEMRG